MLQRTISSKSGWRQTSSSNSGEPELSDFEELCGFDWHWLSLDGVMTKALFGGEKIGPNPTDLGKCGVKLSPLTEGHGVPVGVVIQGTQRHNMKLVHQTIESIGVERPGPNEEYR
jgi:putative transposase